MNREFLSKIRTFEVIKKPNTWSADELVSHPSKRVKIYRNACEEFEVVESIVQEQTLETNLAIESESKGHFVHEAGDLAHKADGELLIMMWNVNSLNSKLDREHFIQYVNSKPFDIICFNETKYSEKKFKQLKIEKHPLWHGKYHQYWHFSTKKLGYSGVAVLTRFKPIACRFGFDSAFDCEGRAVTLEFEGFYLGFIDAYRERHPEKREYSWWDPRFQARAKNDGWRLDYCVISEESIGRIKDVSLRTDVFGSDHCPLEVRFDSGRKIKTNQRENPLESTERTEQIISKD